MPLLGRTLPSAFFVAVAFATPFVVVACGDVQPFPLSSAAATSSGSSSTSAASSTGAGGSSATTTTTAATGAGGSGGATSTTSAGGAGGALATSSGATGGAGGGAVDAGDPDAASDAGDASDAAIEPDSPSLCGTTVAAYPIDPSPHVTACFPVVYSSNPPTSGPHYPIWASFKTFTTPVPRGFTVHDLEHGAIVISYKCAAGCAADLAALQAFVDARPADPLCALPVKSRIVITPDPLLDVPFAAAAWGFALTSQCFDLPALAAFIDAHYAMAPENFCFEGTDVTSPDAGVPADCGAPSDAGAGPD
jgi:hypothetical protein